MLGSWGDSETKILLDINASLFLPVLVWTSPKIFQASLFLGYFLVIDIARFSAFFNRTKKKDEIDVLPAFQPLRGSFFHFFGGLSHSRIFEVSR